MLLQQLVLRTSYSVKSIDKAMISLLLNIGHDFAGLLIEMIAYVNKVRASSRLLKIILWPVAYALTFVKVMTLYLANGCRQFYNHSFPDGVLAMRNHIYSATPASIYCFNKSRLFIFLLEAYFFCFFCGWCFERPMRMVPYLVVKVIVTTLPFLTLSPTQRLPF